MIIPNNLLSHVISVDKLRYFERYLRVHLFTETIWILQQPGEKHGNFLLDDRDKSMYLGVVVEPMKVTAMFAPWLPVIHPYRKTCGSSFCAERA